MKQILIFWCRYGIAPRLSGHHGNEQPRIEVLNPCDDGDDQKTPTTILFSNEGEFIGKYPNQFLISAPSIHSNLIFSFLIPYSLRKGRFVKLCRNA
jgi:hypothetical protein